MNEPIYRWEAPDKAYPWVGRPDSGPMSLTVDLGSYFIQCEAPTASEMSYWNGHKGSHGGPGIKTFALYAESEPTPKVDWPYQRGAGEPLATCEVESPYEAQDFFAKWLLALAAEAIAEGA